MSKCTICGTEQKLLLFSEYCPNEEKHSKPGRTFGSTINWTDVELTSGTPIVLQSKTTLPAGPVYWKSFPKHLSVLRGQARLACNHNTDIYWDGPTSNWWCFYCGTRCNPPVMPGADIRSP